MTNNHKGNYTATVLYKGTTWSITYKAKDIEHAEAILPIKIGHRVTDISNAKLISIKEERQ